MKYEILKGSDGRRWGRVMGSGLVAELRAGDPPPKPKKGKAK
jgi:hypothetical protein